MFALKLSPRAYADLNFFLGSYEEAFFNLYFDSGIWSEAEIIDQYRRAALDLGDRIFVEIQKGLSPDIVLGRRKHADMSEIAFYVGSRLIIVVYSEIGHSRIVETIGIDRKPIIF